MSKLDSSIYYRLPSGEVTQGLQITQNVQEVSDFLSSQFNTRLHLKLESERDVSFGYIVKRRYHHKGIKQKPIPQSFTETC